jgi:hypothetical protein
VLREFRARLLGDDQPERLLGGRSLWYRLRNLAALAERYPRIEWFLAMPHPTVQMP